MNLQPLSLDAIKEIFPHLAHLHQTTDAFAISQSHDHNHLVAFIGKQNTAKWPHVDFPHNTLFIYNEQPLP